MKKNIPVTFLVMLFLWSACGIIDKNPTITQEEKSFYVAEKLFREDNYEWLSSCHAGTSIYDIGRDEEKQEYCVWRYDCETLSVTKTVLATDNLRFVRYVRGYVGADGSLRTLCGTVNEAGTAVEDYYLCTFDAEGKMCSKRKVTKGVSSVMEKNNAGFQYSFVLPDDKLLIFNTNSLATKMSRISEDGNVEFEKKLGVFGLFDCQLREDGKILLLEYQDSGRKISMSEVNADNGKRKVLIGNLQLPYGTMPVFAWGRDPQMICFQTTESVWEYDLAENKLKQMFFFEDSMLDGRNVGDAWQRADGDWCLRYLTTNGDEHDFSAYTTELVKLSKAENYAANKVELTYAVVGPENLFMDDAISFNLSQDQIKIKVKTYESVERFLADVIAGNYPDLVNLDDGDIYEALRKKELLEDLSNYFVTEGDLSKEDFLSKSLEFYEENGRIYSIPYGLVIYALMVDERYLRNYVPWDLPQFKDFLRSLPNINMAMGGCSKQEFLFQVCYNHMERFVDGAKRTCNFQTDEFIDLLEMASFFPEEDLDNDSTWVMRRNAILDGESVLKIVSIGEVSEYEYERAMFPGKGRIVGFPTDHGNGVSLGSGGIAPAIMRTSGRKEEAWEFIKYVLTKERNHLYTSLFPSYKPVLNEIFEEAREQVGTDYQCQYGDHVSYVPHASLSEIEELQNLLNVGQAAKGGSEKILQIIWEEAEVYFKGGMSAKEAAEKIQNRVALYLSE